MTSGHKLTRRALLEMTALAAAAYASPQGAFSSPPAPSAVPSAFALSEPARAMVGLIAETILPSSETPGAAEAGVADFIGHMLANWYSAEERERFLSGLDEFAARCVAETGKSFGDLMHDERHRFAEDRDREALALGPRSLATAPFFAAVKELTLIGYYTSSVGSAAIGYLGPIGAGPADEKLGCGAVWN